MQQILETTINSSTWTAITANVPGDGYGAVTRTNVNWLMSSDAAGADFLTVQYEPIKAVSLDMSIKTGVIMFYAKLVSGSDDVLETVIVKR